jgi:hypothetical protein
MGACTLDPLQQVTIARKPLQFLVFFFNKLCSF